MAHDFDFLRARWPKLAALASDAKRLVTISPTVSVSSMLTFCDWASDIILHMTDVPVSDEDILSDKIIAMRQCRAIPSEVVDRFESILAAPDQMRNPLGSADVSAACMQAVEEIAQWMVRYDSRGAHKPAAPAPVPTRIPEEADDVPAYEDAAEEESAEIYEDDAGEEYEDDIEEDEAPRFALPPQIQDFLDSFRNGFGTGKNPLIFIIPAVVLIVLLIILGFVIGGRNKPVASPTPTLPLAPESTLTAAPVVTPTPSPTPAPEVTTYLQDIEFSSDSTLDVNKIHKGRWSSEKYSGEFNIDGTAYDHGIGMFIASADITDVRATKTLVVPLNGEYNTFITDYGAERNWDFGNSSDRGSYRISIKVDGVVAYEGDGLAGPDGGVKDVRINVTGAQSMTIELTQRKGSRGTLNIVLGDARLISGGAIVTEEPTETDTPGEDTTTPDEPNEPDEPADPAA